MRLGAVPNESVAFAESFEPFGKMIVLLLPNSVLGDVSWRTSQNLGDSAAPSSIIEARTLSVATWALQYWRSASGKKLFFRPCCPLTLYAESRGKHAGQGVVGAFFNLGLPTPRAGQRVGLPD